MNTLERGCRALTAAGAVGLVFGLLTVFSGGTALFGGEAARTAVGNAVPFVLWFNFIAGFFYVLAGVGLLMKTELGCLAIDRHSGGDCSGAGSLRPACGSRRAL